MANLQAMETGFPAGVSVAGLGDQSYAATGPVLTYDAFFVIWRSGVLTQRLEITAPPGTLTLHSARSRPGAGSPRAGGDRRRVLSQLAHQPQTRRCTKHGAPAILSE